MLTPKDVNVEHRTSMGRLLTAGDPTMRFSDSMRRVGISLDTRTDEELIQDGLHHGDAVIREQALYTLAHRQGDDAFETLKSAALRDPDPQVRINVLWLMENLRKDECAELGRLLAKDENPRVREWARVFAWEMGWSNEDFRTATQAMHWPNRTFDQTIYLHIQCDVYVRLAESNELWGHLVMSPQMLARVYGQAYACPIFKTREKEIVIAKTLDGLHADGSSHYECFLFRGFTERTTETTGNFYFETHTKRPFFLSGKADDTSEGVVDEITIPFAREGQWFLNPNIAVNGVHPIEYVRGLFQGWGFVNFARIQSEGGEYFWPGNSVLSTLHHPEVGARTNAFISGHFKGKVLDWNNDGILDLNYLQSPSTAAGEVDSDFDGIPDVPGQTVCNRFHDR